ncbi:MAG: molecular chaperone DnaJ, partial [Candidatus Paceibacterota bacterium]
MDKDYYTILGVGKNASKEEVKKAFHKLAHKYHPDKKTGDEKRFKEVNEAYGVLSNEKKRAEYDAYGRVFSGGSGGQTSGFEGFDFSDFASHFGGAQGGQGSQWEFDIGDIFGDFFGGARKGARRGRDISVDVEISFKESVFGTTRKLLITKAGVCEACEGTGAKDKEALVTCEKCNGAGKVRDTKQSFLGTVSTIRACSVCDGTGKVPKEKCETCKGEGVLRKEDEIHVSIPAGINNGEMIRLSGRGEAVKGGVPGDLYVKVHVEKHSNFEKEGSNLRMTLNVKLTDALLGSTYQIDTLEGNFGVKIPAGITSGEVLRLKGRGIPSGNTRGDLLIKVHIPLPKSLSKKAKKLIEELK